MANVCLAHDVLSSGTSSLYLLLTVKALLSAATTADMLCTQLDGDLACPGGREHSAALGSWWRRVSSGRDEELQQRRRVTLPDSRTVAAEKLVISEGQ